MFNVELARFDSWYAISCKEFDRPGIQLNRILTWVRLIIGVSCLGGFEWGKTQVAREHSKEFDYWSGGANG